MIDKRDRMNKFKFMNKTIFICIAAIILTGCQSLDDKKMLFAGLYMVGESQHWKTYAKDKNNFSLSPGTLEDQKYIQNRLNQDYLAYLDKMENLASGKLVNFFGNKSGEVTKALKEENAKVNFKINKLLTLTDNQTSQKFGYCVTFKFLVTNSATQDNTDSFAYFDVNEKFSILASGDEFVNKLCGNGFYISPENTKNSNQNNGA